MINFRFIIEKLFKSFDISNDLKLIERLEKDWIRFLMIIKRHWFYWVINSWRVILSFIIVLINSYLLIFWSKTEDIIWVIIWIFLFINIVYWIFVIILYLYRFYKIHGSEPYIEDVYSSIRKAKLWNEAFTKFFNQTIFLFILNIAIFFFIVFSMVFMDYSFGFSILNLFLIFIQIWLFYSFLNHMINIEMDFKVCVPWSIIFYNQKWLLSDTQTIDSTKIKSMNSNYPGIIASIFKYWNILILAEWDQKNNWEMAMDYIWNPPKTINEMQKVMNEDLSSIEKDVNLLLKRFKKEIWITDISTKENKIKLKEFVLNNEDTIKSIFQNWDEETKREVKELYIIINEV